MPQPHVIVYSRPGCHLCDEAKHVILTAGCDDQFTLEEINIESDSQLLRKYQHDIPVVTLNGEEIFRHRVNADKFRELVQVKFAG